MKIIYFFVLFVLCPTLSNAMESNELESIIESLKPQRTHPHSVVNRPQEHFHEYYLSGAGLSCGFRIFGLERKEGISLIRQNLTSATIQKFVSNSIFQEEANKFKEIYHQEKEDIDLEGFSADDKNRHTYLDFYAEENRALPLEVNRFENGAPVPNYEKTFGLLDALALLQKKNLYVYVRREGDPSSLLLVHTCFIHVDSPYLRSLYHSDHFNFLVDRTDKKACDEAECQETLYLEQQRKRLASSSDCEEAEKATSVSSSDIISLDEDDSSDLEFQQNIPEERDSNVPARAAIPLVTELWSEVEEPRSFAPRTLNLTLETVSQFINQDKGVSHFSKLTRKESIEAAFTFLKNGLTSTTSSLSEEDKIMYQFGIVRLFLEFDYHPSPLSLNQHGNDLSQHIKSIIKKYSKSREAKLKRFANYARIYLGKLYVVLGHFAEAYKVFQQIGNRYTKAYYVDMAEMIIDHGYRPAELGDKDPNEFAISLLMKASKSSKENGERHTRVRKKSRGSTEANPESLGRPHFLTKKTVRKRYTEVYKAAKKTKNLSNQIKETERLKSTKKTPQGSPRIIEKKRPFPQERGPRKTLKRVGQGVRRLGNSDIDDILTSDSEGEFTLSMEVETESDEEKTESDEEKWGFEVDKLPLLRSFSSPTPEGIAEKENELTGLSQTFSSGNLRQEYRRLLCLGKAHRNEKAGFYFWSAKSIAEEIGDRFLEAQALIGLGNARAGTEHYRAALVIAREIKDLSLEVQALIGLGNARDSNRIEHYRDALDIAREIKDLSLEAQALIGLGNARAGTEHYRAALVIAREIKDLSLEAQALIGLGNARAGTEHYRAALVIAREIKDLSLEAQALIGLGNAHAGTEHYRAALVIAREIKDLSLEAQALIGLGNARAGTEHYRAALVIAREIKDLSLEAQALIGLGNARAGAEHYRAALKIAQELKDRSLEAQALIGLGNARDGNQIEHYQAALDIAREIKDLSLEAQALIGLGNARDGNQIEHYQAALDIAREIKDLSLEAQALIGLGNARDGNRIEHYRAALGIAQEIGDRSLEAQALIGLGNARDSNRIEHYRAALDIAQEIGDLSLEAQALIGLGKVHDGNQIGRYRAALDIAQKIGDLSLEAKAEIGLGNARAGTEHYRAALDIVQEIGDLSLEAQALIGLGNARAGTEHYRAALVIAREIKDLSLEAQALIGLGNARAGTEHYRAALVIAREIKDFSLEAQALIGLGNARAGTEHYRAALVIAREIKDLSLEAQALIGLGNARDSNRIEHYRDALDIAREIKDLSLEAQALIGLGNARAGIEHYRAALDIARKIGDLFLEAQAKIGLGNAYCAAKNNEEGLKHFSKALKIAPTQELRNKALSGQKKAQSFIKSNRR